MVRRFVPGVGRVARAGAVAARSVIVVIAVSLALGATFAAAADAPALVTLHADNAPVIEILDLLAARSGLNIVAGSEAQGRTITLHLKDTPFDEALALVARASGLAFERMGNSILVAGPDQMASPGEMGVQVFDLDWAKAEEVREALETVTSDIRADVRGNRVIVHAGRADLALAAGIIEAMDVKPNQVLLEARLIEVNTNKLLEIGIDWSKVTQWSTVVTEGYWGATAPGSAPEAIDFLPVGDGARMHRQAGSWELSVEALLSDGHAKLLANSKIVTIDGESAEIFAGETVPVVITSLQSPGGSGGTLQTVQLEKIDVGVRLNITPQLGDDGLITTLVEPEVSSIIDFVGPDNDLPQTSTRRARALVRVRDGEKIYMGGLLTEEKRDTVKKVPLLGDIPLLGHLFRHTRHEVDRMDLIIEITPHIVGDAGGLVPTSLQQHPDVDLGFAAPKQAPAKDTPAKVAPSVDISTPGN